ncbi:MAG: membrane-bound dehydrogenase, partial [Planctomycetota bacterium]
AEKTACATCHDSRSDYQLGPSLTSARKETTPEHLIKSILQPSVDILKGYQTVNVVTADGAIVSGFLVEETDEKVTLSLSSEKGKKREILDEDIDDLVESKVSTMPTGIVKFLKNRKEFLDLSRFVIEVNAGGKKKLKELKQKAKVQSP